MMEQTYNQRASSVGAFSLGGVLLSEYETFDGDGIEFIRKRREFCSEFFVLSPTTQEMVLAAQSPHSLKRFLTTIERFKNIDTGEHTHQRQIDMIKTELDNREHQKQKQITMSQLEKALDGLRNRRF